MRIRGLSGSSFGIEVSDFDCSKATSVDMAKIEFLLLSSGLIVFRNQSLTSDKQVNFTEYFGTPDMAWDNRNRSEENFRVQVITNTFQGGKYHYSRDQILSTVRYWHADTSFLANPTRYTFLQCVQCPDKYGNTIFANTELALQDLSNTVQLNLEALEALHSFDFLFGKLLKIRGNERSDIIPDVIHPLIWEMPDKKALYLSELSMKKIVGLSNEESDKIITQVSAHCFLPKYRYVHEWINGDFLVFDNLGLVHKGGYTDPEYPRTLHRTTTNFFSI